MRFSNVSIVAVGHVDAPHRVTSDELEAPLAETYARLDMPPRLLQPLTGVVARRYWDEGTQPSDGATLAARRVLAESGVDPARIGVLVNTSVCRDWVEPSTACFVHHKLGLGETCINFDVANACLGFLDGMNIVGNMIERGQVDYGLVVDCESSRRVVEATIARLRLPSCDQAMLREQLATLTVGSGAAAMLLAHTRLAPGGHRFIGGVSLAATQHNELCRGQLDEGLTDTRNLLAHGVEIAQRTWARAQKELGWTTAEVDHFALHQVSELHTRELARTLSFDLERAFLIYPELGNVGPASVPIVLSKASEAERMAPGDRVVLAGIGSGLNCTAAGVILVTAFSSPLYPFEGRFLDRGGLRYHYLDEGAGEPVVMVHGNPSWSFYYRELVLALRDRYRVIVPDHIGMGLSDKPADDRYAYRLESRIDDLEALVDSLSLAQPVTLVVHDWGGMIGMGWAARHPERVARIVLLNTAAFHLPDDMRMPAALRLVRNTPLGAFSVRGMNAFARGAINVGVKRRKLSREVRNGYLAPYDSWANRIGTLRFVEDIPLSPSDPSYACVSTIEAALPKFASTPVLACWGERDFVFTPRVLEHWIARWPHAEVHRFPDCGHYVLEDAQAEIAALVRAFLAAHPLP